MGRVNQAIGDVMLQRCVRARRWAVPAVLALACGGGENAAGEPSPVGPAVPASAGGGGSEMTEVRPVEDPLNTDLFVELLAKTPDESEQKVRTAANRFFGIGTEESSTPTQGTGYRCYYELPQDPSMGFIWAADSNDIRSEGMSYGMMIAVQLDLREQFDRLWKFAKTYMQFAPDDPVAAWRHYFRWQGQVATTDPASWTVTYGPTTVPAPDGELYFAAALYLAHRRWGSDGEFNYQEEARAITDALLHNPAAPESARFPIIHSTASMVVFVPYGNSNGFSDPSYHLPAFYELFAIDGPAPDSARWRELAEISREYLVTSAHPETGLHPDYARFDGTPVAGNPGENHDQFRYDAWRVVMNMAVDYAWFSRDERMAAQVDKYHAFFAPLLTANNVQNALFALDGSGASGGGSTALTATLATGALASSHPDRNRFVSNLWDVAQQQGQFRYYQESVYLLGLLNTAGQFRYTWP